VCRTPPEEVMQALEEGESTRGLGGGGNGCGYGWWGRYGADAVPEAELNVEGLRTGTILNRL
jgi:hypothetical protein